MTRASIVIPHFEDVERLRRCLDSLAEIPSGTLGEAEIVVVDNDSPSDLGWVERDFPFARLVVETTRGAAAARNRGVRETGAPRIAFLDCDCVPRRDWLRRVIDLPLAPEGEVVGGAISTFDETPPPRSGAEAFEAVFAFNQKGYVEQKGFSVTANLVTSRELFERVGELRDAVSEDVDWCRRATSGGARLTYDADLSVSHPTRRDWPALRKKWLRTTREAHGIYGDNRLSWLMKALLMPASAVAHVPRVLSSDRIDGAGERFRAVLTLFRLRLARMWWMLLLMLGRDVR